MANNLTPQNANLFLNDTLKLRDNLEFGFLELGARLKKIRDERLFEGHYDSFREFLEEARLTESFASRLITIHIRFIEGFHMKREDLAHVGWSSLYQIAKHTEDEKEAKELVEMARTVRRSDLEDEIRERKTGCVDHELGEETLILRRCVKCGKWVRCES